MAITDVEAFGVELPDHEDGDHRITAFGVVRVETDDGVTGYGFPRGRADEETIAEQVRPALVGADPFDVENLLHDGALAGAPGAEQALWDVMGKTAGQPVHRLLGSSRDRIPYYLTCVWPGSDDQSHLDLEAQADQLARYHDMGHTRFKVRGWRPDPLDDVRMLEMAAEKIDDPDLELMVDRTGPLPDWVWSYDEALAVARGLEDLNERIGATWLEEPFARDDVESYRRLREETDIPITGGEFATDLHTFREYLENDAVDIVQPDCLIAGGVRPTQKVATLAEAFDVPCVLHGTNGPSLAPSLHAAAAIPTCRVKEIALIWPPLTPEEMWEPVEAVLEDGPLYTLEDGDVLLPDGPGLGLGIDDAALQQYRV
jgi:D-galactarolactone cycloisomerase